MYYFCEVAQELARRIMYEEQAKLDALMAFFDDEIEEIAITLKNDHGLVYDRINR